MQMRGTMEKVVRRSLVWKNIGAPKWIFILYLAVKGRLATKDRLAKWGIIHSQTCPLCQQANEELDHIFFRCTYAAEVWNNILNWQGIRRKSMNWTAEIQWVIKFMKGKSSTTLVYRMAMASTVYRLDGMQ
ncbi:hypothetical protein RDI58_017839 [Solanum bulbocastanum]|uniref:Reverse transcriptase zinc-binding domain-containing protein n=1 Tax=Solanum bulbocastanum TaxID=147425 RepID=A0AAN8TD27_SOLBU